LTGFAVMPDQITRREPFARGGFFPALTVDTRRAAKLPSSLDFLPDRRETAMRPAS